MEAAARAACSSHNMTVGFWDDEKHWTAVARAALSAAIEALPDATEPHAKVLGGWAIPSHAVRAALLGEGKDP